MEKLLRKVSKVMVLTLILTAAAFMANASSAIAQEVPERPTYAFLSIAPNPVGVNQPVSVMFWLDSAPPTAAGAGGDRWENMTVKITKPDNSVETKGPYRSDAVGGAYFMYTPTTTGTYKFQMFFPGQTVAGIYFKASQSRIVELVVQTEPVEAWPDLPLPTSYWTRPINAELRNWYQIAGNWLMPAYNTLVRPFDTGGAFNPYTTAPESPHVLWTKELTFGGIVGGEFGYGENYYTGMSYEMKFTPPIIIGGRLYYNDPSYPRDTFYCIDLRTGELLWKQTVPVVSPPPASVGGIFPGNIPITLGQIYKYDSPNQHGAQAYLWSINGPGTEWKMYDAFTGKLMITFRNASAASFYTFGPSGELLGYILYVAQRRLVLWNSSKAIPPAWPSGSGAWQWRPALTGTLLDWRGGIQWNVSLPDPSVLPGPPAALSVSLAWVAQGVVLLESVVKGFPWPTFVHVGLNATTGTLLWHQNRTNMGWGFGGIGRPGLLWTVAAPQPREGVYVVFQKETMQWHAFNITTGNKLWSTESLNKYTNTDWSMYDVAGAIAYGKLFTTGYSGCVNAFDLRTGSHLWTFSVGSSGLETPYGSWPFYGGITIADGKLYVANGEHSPGTPLWRGEKLYCLNATTGDLIWSMPGWFIGNSLAIADGILIGYNGYDNRIYALGKGKTQTTLTITQDVVSKGSSILIKGTVTDESPAVKGTPCVADDSISGWMEYLVMQKPMPKTVSGVNVELYAIDETGAASYIDTVCTDPLNGGVFRKLWTPPKEGTYIITAVFRGSKSYWGSYASTAIGVTSAPPAVATAEQATFTQMLIATIAVLVIICMILVAYVIYVNRRILKKA